MKPDPSPGIIASEKIRKLSKLNERDIIILVMGLTGSGKSHFIDLLTSQPHTYANSGLRSSTNLVNPIRIKGHSAYGDDLVIVDTPGFDDTYKPDREILGVICDWLAKTYKMNIKISAVLYFQRITDIRMSDAIYRSFYVFSELCGVVTKNHVALVTTMWNLVDDMREGEEVEKNLRERLWSLMSDPENEACTGRLYDTRTSAWGIVETLLNGFPIRDKVDLLVQKEICDDRKSFKQSAAFQALYASLESIHNSRQRHHKGLRTTDEILADYRSTQVQVNEILREFIPSSEKDIVIPVMGPTGAGKSTFINEIMKGEYMDKLDQQDLMKVGNSLASCTKNVRVAMLPPTPQGLRIVMVDTPGFDDTYEEDKVILERIAAWLKYSYEDPSTALAGVIYLHDISQDRFPGAAFRSLAVFKALCGIPVFDKIILGSTKWSKVEEKAGKAREEELSTTHWKHLIDNGARIRRYVNTYPSARGFIDTALERITDNTALEIQIELAVQKKTVTQTKAGQEYLHQQLIEIRRQIEWANDLEDKERLRKAEQHLLKDVPTSLAMRIRRLLRL